ncbi:hypothetical protein ABR2090_1265 [Acinetobacter baumannii]|nr:hypothetical protein ABR2090_1265 [Acinetobacter baumannii]
MKLAEALLLRSDQQKKLALLKQRINANVLYKTVMNLVKIQMS